MSGILIAHVFFNLPLAVRLLLLAWKDIPNEQFKIGSALGFNNNAFFYHLELPMLRGILPGLLLLIKAHKELESITLSPDVVDFKGIVEKKWGQLVYQGFWFGPLKDSLDAFISSTQTSVNGRVKIRLYKGNAIVIGRKSENNSLYREDLATYSKDDVFNHSLAEGFIYMWGMSNKIWAELNSKTKD